MGVPVSASQQPPFTRVPPMRNEVPFFVSSADLDDGRVEVVVNGEIDANNSKALEAELLAAAERGGDVVVDLTGVGFLDSSGISALLTSRAALLDQRHKLLVGGASHNVARVLEIVGVYDLLTTG